MASIFKSLWAGLRGRAATEAEGEAVEYSGYRIRPTPYARGGGYQTCGIITKEVAGAIREHRFVRAETHPGWDSAVAFSIAKGKQIIDEQGDRLFG